MGHLILGRPQEHTYRWISCSSQEVHSIEIVKWDGRREEFDGGKLRRSIARMGASSSLAETIAEQIEERVYDGISSEEIFSMVTSGLEDFEPAIALRQDLRTGLARMGGGAVFEEYVRIVLRANGFEVEGNKQVRGKCVTHEVDGVVTGDGECRYLEVKHHSHPHRYTPFDVTLAARAKLDDMRAGHEEGTTPYCFDRVLVICNTRLSSHAQKYADCVGIDHLGWNVPFGKGLDHLIERGNLYPITTLRNLTRNERDLLFAENILLLEQLVELSGSSRIDTERLTDLKQQASAILELSHEINGNEGDTV